MANDPLDFVVDLGALAELGIENLYISQGQWVAKGSTYQYGGLGTTPRHAVCDLANKNLKSMIKRIKDRERELKDLYRVQRQLNKMLEVLEGNLNVRPKG